MQVNAGFAREAVPFERRFVRDFDDADTVVSPSASCTALVRALIRS